MRRDRHQSSERRTRTLHADALPMPAGLTASSFHVGKLELAILSFPVEREFVAPELSRAELDVVLGAIEGLSNSRIARQRRTSVRTVVNQLASAYRKLGISSRIELARRLGAEPDATSRERS
jgi:DNA-binding NarL/FixJ family response regulator